MSWQLVLVEFTSGRGAVISYSLVLLLFRLGCRWQLTVGYLVKMQINFAFCMTILNCWYGITENWQISWGISFHTNASTSVAVTNGTSFPFLGTCSLMLHFFFTFNVTLHQNSKFGSLRIGLAFQIENPLSCRRVWKVDLWNIYKNKILQDLCSTVALTNISRTNIFVFGNG